MDENDEGPKKALTLVDLGEFEVHAPSALPASKGPKPTPLSALRAALKALYNGSAVLQQQLTSQTHKASWSGSCHWDKGFAAATLAAYIEKEKVPGMAGVKNPLAMVRHYLPQVLKEHDLDRQTLIAQAIADGTKAKADAAAEAEVEETQAQAAAAAE